MDGPLVKLCPIFVGGHSFMVQGSKVSFNPIRTEGVSRKHTSYIIDSHVKMSEVNGFFFLDFAN